ncbi:mediator of RNA polymerase II transcription subunit 10 [Colletotrichum liriopes]|uniref:Mediator of RNA polymerase II transcription subunit 10 n=1 Tax=Colletotrichum liriopes TaxID=708192 RepID=A0AA37LWB7_9PEZI|nr:mediator of RNA polymerase II transcription subunit 10 [Colletotrichum liriopes]
MAPLDKPTPAELEQQLKDTIQDLYQIMVQVTTYNATPRTPRARRSPSALPVPPARAHDRHRRRPPSPDLPGALPKIPPELVQYVENGRNPDIYTREFVELVRRGNQLMKGKMGAFAQFRDVLADHIERGMPELRDDVARVLESTKVVGSGRPGAN